jgi:hypothetical protein
MLKEDSSTTTTAKFYKLNTITMWFVTSTTQMHNIVQSGSSLIDGLNEKH